MTGFRLACNTDIFQKYTFTFVLDKRVKIGRIQGYAITNYMSIVSKHTKGLSVLKI